MCGPTNNANQTYATAGNVLGTYGQMQAAKNNAAYQASVANQNAAIASAQAISVGQAGANQQVNIRNRADQMAGTQKSALAANGLDIGSGSPLAILSNTAYLGEQDAQTSRQNTELQMWGLNNQAANYKTQANAATAAGDNQANTALLNGITAASKQYATFGKSSVGVPVSNKPAFNSALAPTDANGNYFIGGKPNYTVGVKRR